MADNSLLSNIAIERRKRSRSQNDETPPAACDQCRSRKVRFQPECSNCRKAGVPCISSSISKRVNHTKQLRNDFSSVLERLDDVDQTLNTLAQLTQQIAAQTHPPSPKSRSHTPLLAQPTIPPSFSDRFVIIPNNRGQSSESTVNWEHRHETVKLENGGERIYPYPAALALIKSLSRQLAQVLTESSGRNDNSTEAISKDLARQAALRRQLNEFPNPRCQQPITMSDYMAIATPPRFLVDLFVESFLRNFNIRTPIFDRASLCHAIDVHYSRSASGSLEESAWALIFNNIVLLGLGVEAQASRYGLSDTRSTSDDIIPVFLKNIDRALASLESFTRPSLNNIQALLTLAIVARQFYRNTIFERICHTVCQVARTIGLHRANSFRRNAHDDTVERKRIFQVIYDLDKQHVFLSGQPCDLYIFDSDTGIFPSIKPESPVQQLHNAFNCLMEIWEEIYLALYSSRATSAGKPARVRQIRHVAHLIEEWYQQNHGVMEAAPLNEDEDFVSIRVELKYCYHVSHILCLHGSYCNDQQELLLHARVCLGLVCKASSSFSTSNIAVLGRILSSYPVVAFIDLVSFHINVLANGDTRPAELEADFDMLWTFCHCVQFLKHPSLPMVYFTHLLNGLTWALGVFEVMKTGSTDRSQMLLDSTNDVSSDQQHSNVATPDDTPNPRLITTSTDCPILLTMGNTSNDTKISQPESEFASFNFCTSAPPSTSLDLYPNLDYPLNNHLDDNLEADFLSEAFALNE
ncbi:fungal-specific transcription factor domain-containing protein [Rostrohypoxylon terebratum]|nr:fungal-specific transcription factor domain-containing protein [Rostrohypoxylon terebratum]